MEFRDVVRRRKMVRSFEDRPIPADVVERILAHARRGPSAGFAQGSAFLTFEGRDEVARFWRATMLPDGRAATGWKPELWPDCFNAPLVIVCLSNADAYLDRFAEADKTWQDRATAHWPVPYWDIDTAMAAMLILLSAVDDGLGALFFGIFDVDGFRHAFGVPPRHTPIGAIAIGYPKAHDRPTPSLARGRRATDEVVHRGGAW